MKKIILFIIFITCILLTNVNAANYEMRELIPKDIKTTIRGENLLYKDFVYENGFVIFDKIKNNSKENKKLTVSIALFGKDKKNIGAVFYCTDEVLSPKQELENYMIEITASHLAEDKTFNDIYYIAILDENENCTKFASRDFIGQTIEEIGIAKNTQLSDSAELLLNMLKIIAIVLVIIFLYKFIFTSAYQNMDGTDVRQEYAYINKKLRKEREKKEKKFFKVPKEEKKNKEDKILKQEIEENKKSKNNDTDLHNFYK